MVAKYEQINNSRKYTKIYTKYYNMLQKWQNILSKLSYLEINFCDLSFTVILIG